MWLSVSERCLHWKEIKIRVQSRSWEEVVLLADENLEAIILNCLFRQLF